MGDQSFMHGTVRITGCYVVNALHDIDGEQTK